MQRENGVRLKDPVELVHQLLLLIEWRIHCALGDEGVNPHKVNYLGPRSQNVPPLPGTP